MNLLNCLKQIKMRSLSIASLLILSCCLAYSQKNKEDNSLEENRLKLIFYYGRGLYCESNQCVMNSVKAIKDTFSFEGIYRINGQNRKVIEINYNLRVFMRGFYLDYNVNNRFAIDCLESKAKENSFYLIEVLSIKLDNGVTFNCPKLFNRPVLEPKFCEPITEKHNDLYAAQIKSFYERYSKMSNDSFFNGQNNLYEWLRDNYQGVFIIIK